MRPPFLVASDNDLLSDALDVGFKDLRPIMPRYHGCYLFCAHGCARDAFPRPRAYEFIRGWSRSRFVTGLISTGAYERFGGRLRLLCRVGFATVFGEHFRRRLLYNDPGMPQGKRERKV